MTRKLQEKDGGAPKVTIGLPVYNGGDHLQIAIDALLSQDLTDFELIIADNASTDATEPLCRAYAARDTRVRYFRRDKNYGIVDNGRYPLSLARGAYYLAAAHDDEWLPGAIGACVKRLDANPALALVSTGIEFFRPDGSPVEVAYPPIRTVGMGIRDRVATIFHENNVGYNAYGMYRRETLLKVNFDVPCYANDVVFLLQLMFLGDIDHIPEKLFKYCFAVKTVEQHAAAFGKEVSDKNPTKLYTILTINLFRTIMSAPISPALRRVLIGDALEIIAVKNGNWRRRILWENPDLVPFVEPDQGGLTPDTGINLLAAFAALLLPYCTPGTACEGAIDFSDIEGFAAIAGIDRVRPAPGVREYTDTLARILQAGRFARGLAYFDEYRTRQPATEMTEKLDAVVNAVRPDPARSLLGSQSPDRLRIVLQDGNPAEERGAEIRQKLLEHLVKRGHTVSIRSSLPIEGADVIHAFGLTNTPSAESLLDLSLGNQLPFVISGLVDDPARYREKAAQWRLSLKTYIENGQRRGDLEKILRESTAAPLELPRPAPLVARYAHRVIAGGPTEAHLLKKLSPQASIAIVPLGVDRDGENVEADLFCKEYGVKDFVLCVADHSTLNNQLMLLIALEQERMPVVLIDDGISREPEYAALCRAVRREGPTIVVSSPSRELLYSAYRAAKVFCLPAWSYITCLSTIEAARCGCAVVASRWGAAIDYFGDACDYCDPDSPESVRSAVLRSIEHGPNPELQQRAANFTWENTAERLEALYRELLA
jgi:glycosyltransferase involved in cell wall biosynthesis